VFVEGTDPEAYLLIEARLGDDPHWEFAFARMTFPGREVLFTFFALGLLFPTAVAILPLYILVRGLGLLDSPLGVAIPQAAFQLPLTILILRPFFRSPDRGAETSVYLATSPAVADVSGRYFANSREKRPSAAAQDMDAARRLWAASEALIAS
jgi:hypothetical protein